MYLTVYIERFTVVLLTDSHILIVNKSSNGLMVIAVGSHPDCE